MLAIAVIVVVPVMLKKDPSLGGVIVDADAMFAPADTICLVNAYACRRPSSANVRSSAPAGPLLAAVTDRDSIVVGMAMIFPFCGG